MSGNQHQETKSQLDTIESAIEAVRNGKIVIVVDDEDRENEGDFITAARNATPEVINFMATHGRGLICAPLVEDRCDELQLDLMVNSNSSHYETPFTVSVDLIGHGCTTGISASDRAKTVLALVDKNTRPDELGKPGHIFPLKAKKEGVLRRTGHTEAAIDLARLAGFEPAGLLVEILKEDGECARLNDLYLIADKFDMPIVSIKDLVEYRLQHDRMIAREVEVNMPTKYGDFKLVAYKQSGSNDEHFALVKGEWEIDDPVLVRVHSSCITGDILGSMRCDCGDQLHNAMKMVEKEGKGVILYMMQEGRGIGFMNKLKAYKLQEEGMDTVDANIALGFKADQRDFGIGAQILRDLNVTKMKLITNNPKKRAALNGYGLEIVENIPIQIVPNPFNKKYLETKRDKMGHELNKDHH
ncbi:MAG TPA: bifunctional 3,4-dihydroxy-2-butanone-4-phosphate synthase/GTP cyclohydrolase II [Chitinophagales bacterium]|jgi:3,4-dihydroxy 2-butanone 4-phosphate synthase/GTP cyclohydrolase II|nr:bifunctional 3,4-dihydroxy-2-butanone-4-phosphate synthase/GTP cyclohydrolase II [Chitinophagales bacterium]MBP6154418.1 bifunctional 3,4-dihydroxy-2-butanone-4-phosphate synthase/GTP cyclohydrolase II [Chitinophagales bacterium]HQV78988.1 bifunctional 3,4-dihydroxy-2-butanone-4-phosphate synthase/GTP cyclohydrolase II [Chitinophagales bacterium]HQW79970.1 bifunctional 3,4-dihydroxy-2-butanone-4-phosphate synthase/GTP cyclohydrolase II [Chitinophagales bacterium]HRB67733.1 bifunctional 3,4-d